jgi:pyruvate dehydrogenase E1 component alpha subunit
MDAQGMKELRLRIENEIEEEIQDAVRFAEESPFPAPETAMDYTYA